MERGSVLGALSLLPKDRTLPAGTVWGGNPLRRIQKGADSAATGGEDPEAPADAVESERRR
jgi:hypothetical protein